MSCHFQVHFQGQEDPLLLGSFKALYDHRRRCYIGRTLAGVPKPSPTPVVFPHKAIVVRVSRSNLAVTTDAVEIHESDDRPGAVPWAADRWLFPRFNAATGTTRGARIRG
ncbi:hypothetical protein HJFPF1_11317 [Paramyrothecium foliicola]|nr:hypothetical protein HJFPF1_11317 [Paramyrothecium foliicola]